MNQDVGNTIRNMTLTAAVSAIASGEISAAEYTAHISAGIKKYGHLNAVISWDEDQLQKSAIAADNAIKDGKPPSLFCGVPILLKDNINTCHLPTSAGTPSLQGNIPLANAPVAQRLFEAGALLGGKANMHELSSGGTSANPIFGTVANPYKLTHTPGGSSGGVAAGVAARLFPAGIGTDTAGSIRAPASLCGVIGFRPSAGRYPGSGIVPLSSTMDTAGPIARSMDDIMLLDKVMAGETAAIKQKPLSEIRIGVAHDFIGICAPGTMNVINTALAQLGDRGITLVPIELEPLRALHRAAANTVPDMEFLPSMGAYLAEWAPHVDMQTLVEEMASPAAKAFTQQRLANPPAQEDYLKATGESRILLTNTWRQLFEEHRLDAVAFPTTPEAALPLDKDDSVFLNGETAPSWFYFAHTNYASTGGRPGISMPVGLNKEGLPVGLELDGLPDCDLELLAVASMIEEFLPKTPPPPI